MEHTKQIPEWYLEPAAAWQAVVAGAGLQALRTPGSDLLMGPDGHVHAPGFAHFQKLDLLMNKSRDRLGMVQECLQDRHGAGRPDFAGVTGFNNGSIREAGFVIGAMAIGGVIYALAVRRILALLGGQLNMIRAGGLIAAAGFVLAALPLTWPQLTAAATIIGIGFYMIHNSLQTQATELAPSARGAAVSLHAFCFFLGQAAGPPLFGLGITSLGAETTLIIAAATMATLGLALANLLTKAGNTKPV